MKSPLFACNEGTSHVGWYLGAKNEWTQDVFENLSFINATLSTINRATTLNVSSGPSNEYWSSTEKNDQYAYAISFRDGGDDDRDKDDQKRVRAFREIGG